MQILVVLFKMSQNLKQYQIHNLHPKKKKQHKILPVQCESIKYDQIND